MTRLDPIKPDAPMESDTPENAEEKRPVLALLDLSGNKERAIASAESTFDGYSIRLISKADIKGGSLRQMLDYVRALRPAVFLVFTSDLDMQSARGQLMALGLLSGARKIVLGDSSGRAIHHSPLGIIFIEGPRLLIEFLCGYLVVLPLSWLLVALLGLLLRFRRIVRDDRLMPRKMEPESLNILYLRATLSVLQEGGMPTHVEGFQNGMRALGHKLKTFETGRHDQRSADAQNRTPIASDHLQIHPSALVGATKALFELWNNLVFSSDAIRALESMPNVDFIYQRYSRFNFTGALLSIVTGVPLALEFNGSEVWISKHWDPIGQLSILRRIERLNLKSADKIFVVSEVMKNSLASEGVESSRIIVNPNGVNIDVFRPQCGGVSIRKALGIDNRVVVGFVGTFGPWHGAPILAEAARLVSPSANCHFLFVGDGDERPATERILSDGPVGLATFTGRIPHDQVPAYLDACDILASPHVPLADGTEFFGSPTKLFEYMAISRPIVASALGQIADVLEDGVSALLMEPGNAAALARAIEQLANDHGLRARLGANARKAVEVQYTWEANAARVVETMNEKTPAS